MKKLIGLVLLFGLGLSAQPEIVFGAGSNYRDLGQKGTFFLGGGYAGHYVVVDELTGTYRYSGYGLQDQHQFLFGVSNNELVKVCWNHVCLGVTLTAETGETHLTGAKYNLYGNAASFLRLPPSDHFTVNAGLGPRLSIFHTSFSWVWRENKVAAYEPYSSLELRIAHIF
jgi:hypothetical protein